MKKYIIILFLLFNVVVIQANQRYNLKLDSQIVSLSRKIAISQIGVTENKGFNRSTQIDIYNKTVGVPMGSSYCAAGQYYCYEIASKDLNKKNPLPKTAVANNMLNIMKNKAIKTNFKPEIDDFIFWKYPNSWKGHVERIIEVKDGGWIRTIAFNVSFGKDLSNDGQDGVAYKLRNIFHPLAKMRVSGIMGVN